MSEFVPKHINHFFHQDYIRLIETLKSKNSLNVRTIMKETQKMIDSHVENYYKLKDKITSGTSQQIENQNAILKTTVARLSAENKKLQNEIEALNKLIIQLHKEKFDVEQELKETLEGILN